jgi:4-carboxymuconolactone decarboxylase
MERFTQISYDELAPEVRPLADDILKVSSAALGGPYNALLRSPDVALIFWITCDSEHR